MWANTPKRSKSQHLFKILDFWLHVYQNQWVVILWDWAVRLPKCSKNHWFLKDFVRYTLWFWIRWSRFWTAFYSFLLCNTDFSAQNSVKTLNFKNIFVFNLPLKYIGVWKTCFFMFFLQIWAICTIWTPWDSLPRSDVNDARSSAHEFWASRDPRRFNSSKGLESKAHCCRAKRGLIVPIVPEHFFFSKPIPRVTRV